MFQPFNFFQTFPDGGQTSCYCGTKLFHPIILISQPVGTRPQWKKDGQTSSRPAVWATPGARVIETSEIRDGGRQKEKKGMRRKKRERGRLREGGRRRNNTTKDFFQERTSNGCGQSDIKPIHYKSVLIVRWLPIRWHQTGCAIWSRGDYKVVPWGPQKGAFLIALIKSHFV